MRENVKFDNYPPVAQSVSRELQRIQPGELCVEFCD